MIKQIIKDNNITSHKQLQRYLADISDCKHYWDYSTGVEESMVRAGIFDICVLITFDGESRWYENEVI